MTLVSSGQEIKLQGTGDTNPTTSQALSTSLFIGSRSATCYVKVRETDPEPGVGPFYFAYDMVTGAQYGYSVSSGSSTGIPMRDTNPNTTMNSSSTSGYTQNFGWPQWSVDVDGLNPPQEQVYSSLGGWDFSTTSSIGSMSSYVFADGGGTQRTITAVLWQKNQATGTGAVTGSTGTTGNYLTFALLGTSIPDTNTTFTSIDLGSTNFTRSSRTQYDSSENGGTFWRWELTDTQVDSLISNLGTTGNFTFKVNGASQTFNNGIAEEFGGADSLNVTLSHYYRGAPEGFVASGAASTIPNDGTNVELQMGDFFGSAAVASNLHESTFNPGTSGSPYHANSGYNTSFSGSPAMADTSITLDNSKTATIASLYGAYTNTTTTSGNITFGLTYTGGNTANNAGFTTLKIWLNQSNGSGTPELTLSRSSASYYSPTSTAAVWSWARTNIGYSTYFGNNSSTTHFFEIT